MKFNTSLLHGAFRGEPQTGATLTPIYQSSAFEQESAERLEKIFHNQAPGFSYTRINNPTVEAFEKRMTVLEGGKSSVACASGMAAMFNAFANILQAGDEIVSSASLYGGSIDLFRDLEAFGITTHYVENNDLDAFCKDEYFEEFWPEYKNLDELKAHYQRGGLGDVKVKKFLNKVLQAELAPIRARRKEWEQKLPEVFAILKEGSKAAEAKAAETLQDVKAAMRINYFDDADFLN